MSDIQLCTCCMKEATMICAGCSAVGLIVPFCGVEHQEMLWCTHEALCGRIQEGRPYLPPYTMNEHLTDLLAEMSFTDEERRLRPSDGPGSPLESLVKPGDRPLVVPNNTLDTIEDLPLAYLAAFDLHWIQYQQSSSDATDETQVIRTLLRRAYLFRTAEIPSAVPSNTIRPPPIEPSVLPYILISIPLLILWKCEEVMQGDNITAYVDSMLTLATLVSRYIRDPNDSLHNHTKELTDLCVGKVMKEYGKVQCRGPMMDESEVPLRPASGERAVEGRVISCVDWSFIAFATWLVTCSQKDGIYESFR